MLETSPFLPGDRETSSWGERTKDERGNERRNMKYVISEFKAVGLMINVSCGCARIPGRASCLIRLDSDDGLNGEALAVRMATHLTLDIVN